MTCRATTVPPDSTCTALVRVCAKLYAPWLTIAIHPSGPRLTFYIQLWTRMTVGGAPPPSPPPL